MKVTIDKNRLLELLNQQKETCDCNHCTFLAWTPFRVKQDDCLKYIGTTAMGEVTYVESPDYWMENAEVNLKYYPYNGSDVYQCKRCNNLFFHYTEFGGHAPEERIRLIRSHLVV